MHLISFVVKLVRSLINLGVKVDKSHEERRVSFT